MAFKDPEKLRAYRRKWRHENQHKATAYQAKMYRVSPEFRERSKVIAKKSYLKRQGEVEVYKRTHPRIECGEDDSRVLDFHHIDPTTKKCRIGGGTTRGNREREIAKCVVLCANCHRIVEWEKKQQSCDAILTA